MKHLFFLCALCLTVLLSGCQPCVPGEPDPYVVTFEDVPAVSLASSAYGDNLYDQSFVPYTHTLTGLRFGYDFESFEYDGYAYTTWNGIVPSRWNDMETAGFTNQCSVFYKDSETGTGGHSKSSTFAVVYLGTDAEIAFDDPEKEMVIHSLFVTNSSYTALSMLHGDMFCKVFSYQDQDWLKLTFTGHGKDGQVKGTVDCYLADFRTPAGDGIITSWKKVDLSSLGHIHKLTFTMESSDSGPWGMNTPAYFCMDNIIFSEYSLLI